MVGDSEPSLCRSMPCMQSDGSSIVLTLLDSECLWTISPSLSCVLHALVALHIVIVQTHVSWI